MSKNVIQQALDLVNDQISKRLRSTISKMKDASRLMSDLTAAGERIAKSWDGVQEVPNEFRMGVVEVLAVLDAFRSGYASNGTEVSQDQQAQLAKSQTDALALFDARFVPAVKADSDGEALGVLRGLRELLTKALNWESTGGSNPAIHKDPMQSDKTKVEGSIEALQTPSSDGSEVLRKDETVAPAVVVKAAPVVEQISWPRDLAKKGFHGATNPAFTAAAEAVEKAGENAETVWPLDLAPRARR